jgi:hypothetical protein
MGNPLGIVDAVIPGSAAGGQTLYSTVVTDDAELAAALTSNSQDTFIRAGDYTIDLDTIGALDTTPRRFVGAGPEQDGTGPFGTTGVSITFISTGIGLASLDFSASLNEYEGVGFENIFFFSSAPAAAALLTGAFGVINCRFNGGSALSACLTSSTNVVNCAAVNTAAGGAGFVGCQRLANCTVGEDIAGQGAETGFVGCFQLANCNVTYEAGVIGGPNDAFFTCDQMFGCRVNFPSVTGVAGAHYAARFCTNISGFYAIGNSPSVVSIDGLNTCSRVSNSYIELLDVNYSLCFDLTNCVSEHGDATALRQHFIFSQRLKGCSVDGTNDGAGVDGFENCQLLSDCDASNTSGRGFDSCDHLANCRVLDASFDGYRSCRYLTTCLAANCGIDGFSLCDDLSTCVADTNTGRGFVNSDRVVGCQSANNTGDGYVNCKWVSGSTSIGDAATVSGAALTEGFDADSNNFQYVTTPAALTADVNNWTAIGGASVTRVSADALGPWDINGIAPTPAAAHRDRYLRIVNVGANTFNLANQNAGSVAANRIITGTGADIAIAADGSVLLWYDIATARWRVV